MYRHLLFVIIFTKAFPFGYAREPVMFYIIVGAWILIAFVRAMLDPKNRLQLRNAFKN
jgi:hypothetical protein